MRYHEITEAHAPRIVKDEGDVPHAMYASFGDEAYIRFWKTSDGSVVIQSMHSGDGVSGREMLQWLNETYRLPVVVVEATSDAMGFWRKMQREGLVKKVYAATGFPHPLESKSVMFEAKRLSHKAWMRRRKKADEKVSAFMQELQPFLRVQQINANTEYNYMQTPKGKATLTVKKLYSDEPAVEIFWLLAADPGAGRAAMEILCDLADRYGVILQGTAIPLEGYQGGKPFRISLDQLLRFYGSFGFKVLEMHEGHPFIRRYPKKLAKKA